ncbi:hypothetical protein CYY_009661 [Polysphondylium violaceum]|uniref:Transmembrane protein n=1 Tax=Polysphondylium violaceum TaxID=133409 RepID=A0A8J4PMH5_9MYCE|nr:hypothetical protein CYY_009661 [Polysphondylium violaceum]
MDMEEIRTDNSPPAAATHNDAAAASNSHQNKKSVRDHLSSINFRPIHIVVLLISLLMVVYGITQIAVACAKDGISARHAWAFVVNGIFCLVTGLFGISTAFRARKHGKMFLLLNLLTLGESIVLFIAYSALLHHYIKEDCGDNFWWCRDMERYLSVALGIFWSWNIFLIPASLIASIVNLKHHENKDNNNNNSH